MQIAPFAAVIPPEPGLAVATGETYYEGSIGGGLTVPIAGLFVANVDMKASFTPIALYYIWPTPTKEWNFASAVSFPLAWLEVEANLSLGPLPVRKKESMFGLFDLAFTPIVASHHFTQTDHLALSFSFWAPTGDYQKGRLVNLSLNTWTFIPGVAYTKFFRLLLRQCPKKQAETKLSFASGAPSVDSAYAGKRLMAGCSNPTRAEWCTRSIRGANASLTRHFEDDDVQRMKRRINEG
jgi:hypothetical protein